MVCFRFIHTANAGQPILLTAIQSRITKITLATLAIFQAIKPCEYNHSFLMAHYS